MRRGGESISAASMNRGGEIRVLLKSLHLRNFKGIKTFDLGTQGGNVAVYGQNGTGKTTIYDGFLWLLVGKDSANRKDFEIKTLQPNGEPVHGLEHSVEAVLDLDGKEVVLRKIYAEKWTKKRGSAKEVFTGHTTEHFVDGVPVKASEYADRIAQIADEEIFRLLTDPAYFNEQLHWQDRRDLLMEVCGGVSDEDVMASEDKLSGLAEIIADRSLEDHKKIVQARRKEINKELERIPVRIDEVSQGLPDVTDIDAESIQGKINDRERAIREKNQELARIESGGEVAEKKKQISELETRLMEIEREHNSRHQDRLDRLTDEIQEKRSELLDLESTIKSHQIERASNEAELDNLALRTQQLRAKWHGVNEQEFEYHSEDVCPTCGQDLPSDQVSAAREKAVAAFNREKSEQLESISAEGKEAKRLLDALAEATDSLTEMVSKKQGDVTHIKGDIQDAQMRISDLRNEVGDIEDNAEYQETKQKKDCLQSAVAKLQEDTSEARSNLVSDIRGYEQELARLKRELAKLEHHKQGQERMEALKAQERELATEYERIEENVHLMEAFTRAKVDLLEDKINSRFGMVRWQLFAQQVNGGLNECCEATVEGVPYSTALNNGARINAGLDIINVLGEHYGLTAPIFVDNRESLTSMIETRAQVISLIVSTDKKLRIEMQEAVQEAS